MYQNGPPNLENDKLWSSITSVLLKLLNWKFNQILLTLMSFDDLSLVVATKTYFAWLALSQMVEPELNFGFINSKKWWQPQTLEPPARRKLELRKPNIAVNLFPS